MNFSQLLRILWARRVFVAIVTLTTLAVAVVVSLVIPRKYVATASLVIDSRGVDPVTGATTSAQSAANLLATQIDVIASRAVALQVVDQLKLDAGSSPQSAAPASERPSRESVANSLLQSVTVKPAADSNVIRIRFEDSDPVFAALAANGFADAYLQTSLDLRRGPAKQQSAWFEEQLQSLRDSVESERKSLSEYQRSHGIVATDDRLDVETVRLEEISKQLVEAQRAAQEADGRLRQTNQALKSGRVGEMPDVLGNSLLQTMKADLARAEARLAELSERLAVNHPQYMSAAAEVRALRDELAAETRNARGSIEQSAQLARLQANDLQRAFDEQKSRILELRRERDELELRNREVQNAQNAYDSALQRASQVRLESQFNQTSVAILDRASPPKYAATPGLALSSALSVVFGAMLGAALALLLEMMNRRIRARDELADITGVEVLVEVPRLHASFRPGRLLPRRGPRATLDVRPV